MTHFARALDRNTRGATTLEWALLVAAIALPAYGILTFAFDLLLEYYRLMTLVTGLPFP
jgi:hypothetical protein